MTRARTHHRADRAAVVTTAVLQIVREAVNSASVRAAVEAALREEFADIQQQTISQIRPEDE